MSLRVSAASEAISLLCHFEPQVRNLAIESRVFLAVLFEKAVPLKSSPPSHGNSLPVIASSIFSRRSTPHCPAAHSFARIPMALLAKSIRQVLS